MVMGDKLNYYLASSQPRVIWS